MAEIWVNLKSENITVSTNIVTVASLLAATAFNTAADSCVIYSTGTTATSYVSFAILDSAPTAVSQMQQLVAGKAARLNYKGSDLTNKLYIAGSGSLTPVISQDKRWPA